MTSIDDFSRGGSAVASGRGSARRAALSVLAMALALPLTGCLDFLEWLAEEEGDGGSVEVDAGGGGGGGGGSDGGSSDACGGAGRGCITGNVIDERGAAIPSVTVTADGAALGTSNEQGWFFARGVPQGERVSVCFSVATYVTRCRTVALSSGQSLSMTPTVLTKPTVSGSIDATAGGAVADTGTSARFQLPASSACSAASSTPVSGTLTCELSPLDVTRPERRELAPGDFTGRTQGGETVQLVSSGMMDITCRDASGNRVTICSGKTADVQIPIYGTCADDVRNPPTIQSWGFNERTGNWEEYQTFTRVCSGGSYYSGKVSHLSYWNADGRYPVTCLKGTVLGANSAPVEGAQVKCSGVDYSADTQTYSGRGGAFCVPVKPGGSYSCVVAKGTFKTAALTGVATTTPAQCGAPSGCSDLGSITLAEPIARTVLAWGERPRDLDSHFVGPGGLHVYYSSKGSLTSTPYVGLDTDDTDSFGPEVTTLMSGLPTGTYRFCVYNYSGESGGPIAASGATVNVSAGSFQRAYSVPSSNPAAATIWRVYEVTVSSGGATSFRDINDLVPDDSDVATACLK